MLISVWVVIISVIFFFKTFMCVCKKTTLRRTKIINILPNTVNPLVNLVFLSYFRI